MLNNVDMVVHFAESRYFIGFTDAEKVAHYLCVVVAVSSLTPVKVNKVFNRILNWSAK